MAWEGSTRGTRLPPGWSTRTVPRIMARDHHQCQWPTPQGICAWPAKDIDHKVPGDDHRDDNLWALCTWHHDKKTASEGIEARRSRGYRSEKRNIEQHPGLINPERGGG